MDQSVKLQPQTEIATNDMPPGLLYEMVRSFVALASTLNLSHAVKQLGSTRQTLRRHIQQLESAMGGPLFVIDDRRYQLSELGDRSLPGAKDFLARGEMWLTGDLGFVGQLQFLKTQTDEFEFYQEQKPMGLIWQQDSLILREAFRAWSMAGGHIESTHFAHIRPYLMIYRESGKDWICVEFGEKSAYVDWFGLDYARSSIGRTIGQLPAGEAFGHMINEAFFDVQATQLARLDHVYTMMPRFPDPGRSPMAYQRLMMSGFFPDNSPAVMTLVNPTNQVEITGLPPEKVENLNDLHIPELELSEAVFERIAIGE